MRIASVAKEDATAREGKRGSRASELEGIAAREGAPEGSLPEGSLSARSATLRCCRERPQTKGMSSRASGIESCAAEAEKANTFLLFSHSEPLLPPATLTPHEQIFRLAFGPKVFIVVSDPELTKQVLVTDAANYSKGLLSEILDFVMGQGLIPADGEVWRERRRAVVPALHRRYIESMLGMFGDSALHGAAVLERHMGGAVASNSSSSSSSSSSQQQRHATPSSTSSSSSSPASPSSDSVVVEIENFFSRLTLDIIGKAVFNYDFDSLKNDDPFIQAVYTALREAEYRSTAFVPYWNFAPLRWLVREGRRRKRVFCFFE